MKKLKSLSSFQEANLALDTRNAQYVMGGGTHCVIITNCGQGENEDCNTDEQYCDPV